VRANAVAGRFVDGYPSASLAFARKAPWPPGPGCRVCWRRPLLMLP